MAGHAAATAATVAGHGQGGAVWIAGGNRLALARTVTLIAWQ